jgi:hypothetical protein
MGPQQAQDIYEIIQAAQEAEAQWQQAAREAAIAGRPAPPKPPGVDQVISGLENEFENTMPAGRTGISEGFTGRFDNPDPVRAPWRGEYDMPGNFERYQSMANSMAEDAALREAMGSSRRRTEEDDVEGRFALARYPGAEVPIWQALQGRTPAGWIDTGGTPQQKQARADERRAWGREAMEKLGTKYIDRDKWSGFLRSMRGRGARERRAGFRGMMR